MLVFKFDSPLFALLQVKISNRMIASFDDDRFGLEKVQIRRRVREVL